MFKSRIAVLFFLIVFAELGAYIMRPANYGIVPALALMIAILVYGYYELNGLENRRRRTKQLIKEKGALLFNKGNSFSLVELARECGWELDDTRDSELFIKWVGEVEKEEAWTLSDVMFTPSIITKKDNPKK
ncbi:MAG: hypothetical protein ACYC69_11970 [Thermodesulfovibrionales bacterium]